MPPADDDEPTTAGAGGVAGPPADEPADDDEPTTAGAGGVAGPPADEPPGAVAKSSSSSFLLHRASRHFQDWQDHHRVALAFSTYRSGYVVAIGKRDGKTVYLQRKMPRPMGMFVDERGLWIGTKRQLWWLARERGGSGDGEDHDVVFAPRRSWVLGDIDLHDVAVDADGRPVFVSAMYCCLATVDDTYSFRPLWIPPFVSRPAAEDRCHLNGLAMVDGRPGFVTCVSETDIVDGWRQHRSGGGIVVDVESNEVVTRGLSMPHSPRWHDGRLWVLDSGRGHLGTVDLDTGRFEPVCFCPGYARGLTFVGNYAVVGLSDVRDERAFQGLDLEDNLAARGASPWCGLVVVDLDTGDIVHWVQSIDDRVNELYDVVAIDDAVFPNVMGFQGNELTLRVRPAPFED